MNDDPARLKKPAFHFPNRCNEPLYRYVPHIHAEAPLYDINATMVEIMLRLS